MKKTRYQHPTIELCRDCDGTGYVTVFPAEDFLYQTEGTIKTCMLCCGTGRVVVSKITKITIKPFEI